MDILSMAAVKLTALTFCTKIKGGTEYGNAVNTVIGKDPSA